MQPRSNILLEQEPLASAPCRRAVFRRIGSGPLAYDYETSKSAVFWPRGQELAGQAAGEMGNFLSILIFLNGEVRVLKGIQRPVKETVNARDSRIDDWRTGVACGFCP